MAFLGGLILNFMPCVLPVISLKLFGLVNVAQKSPRHILLHNLFYTLGVISTFLILGLVLLLLKWGGEEVGWGFHLQSPLFVGTMILILFLFTLNLFGLFEIATPGGRFLGEVPVQGGHKGDFLTGVLSTILSTPCSAPFLGTALSFAFTSSPLMILLMFFLIGLGLATPFILTGFFPRLVAFLPRPGMWMENLKKFLGLTILLTLVWLYDVFLNLVDVSAGASLWGLNLSLIFLFFLFYARKHMGKGKWEKGLSYCLLAISLGYFYLSLGTGGPGESGRTDLLSSQGVGIEAKEGPKMGNKGEGKVGEMGGQWEKWSLEALERSKNSSELVFMDFTAKWCFTCKVNEKLVLNTDEFQELAKKYNLRLLLADWTKRDPIITQWLKERQIFGVPAYFIQDAEGNLYSLGETISMKEIEDQLAALTIKRR